MISLKKIGHFMQVISQCLLSDPIWRCRCSCLSLVPEASVCSFEASRSVELLNTQPFYTEVKVNRVWDCSSYTSGREVALPLFPLWPLMGCTHLHEPVPVCLNWAGFGCLSSTRLPRPRLLHSPVLWPLHRAKRSQCSRPKDRNSACSSVFCRRSETQLMGFLAEVSLSVNYCQKQSTWKTR